uniref:DNA topoisomerase (ATP-hydrolyzing) n=2 Tax=Trichomonas vaginalis TaxID=5722 RepID=A9NIQ0_TRIVA|nr:SPO11-like protein [Trichomonas vaginalis]
MSEEIYADMLMEYHDPGDIETDQDVMREEIVSYCTTNTISKEECIEKIRNLFIHILNQCKEKNIKNITIPITHRSTAANSQVDPILGTMVQYEQDQKYLLRFTTNPKYFAVFLRVLAVIYHSLQNGEVISKRSIYYREPSLFGSQESVNQAIESICRSLEVNRTALGVISCPKSFVAGPLKWEDASGNIIDVSTHIAPIPALVDQIIKVSTNAIAVMVIEKESIFMRLVQSKIVTEVILITPRGVPDYNTRYFVRLLDDSLSIPIVGLFDGDAYGIFIMHLFKYGSMSAAQDGHAMACPHMMWLGIRPSDLNFLSSNEMLTITDKEEKILRNILTFDHLSEEWKKEIKLILETKRKAEIEALCNSTNYLIDLYLPQKFANHDWI